jgi:Fungal specific transcription factor domain
MSRENWVSSSILSRVQQPCLYDDVNSVLASRLYLSCTPHREADSLETTSTVEALRTLNSQSISAMQLIERYSHLIHPWLPIIDTRRIKDRVDRQHVLEIADPELASLLLCMHLATQPSSRRIRNNETLQEVYAQAQRAFSSLQMLKKFAIGTIQCGLLLAVYQLGAGHLLEAYVTLSTTTGLARVHRLNRTYQKSKEQENEAEAVWWAIFLLDR